MRVTVVMTDLFDTGANRVTLDRAARWQAAGDQVVVYVVLRAETDGPVPLPPGLDVRHGNPGPRQLRSALPAALVGLIGLARRSDVLVAGTEVGFGLLVAAAASRLTRRPLAVTIQSRVDLAVDSYVDWWLRSITRSTLRSADLAVCVAAGLVPPLLALGAQARRVEVAANAVAADEVRAAAAVGPELDGSLPVVVGSGRLTSQKGFDLLVRAHAAALGHGAPHRLLVLGEGEERAALTELARELGVEGSVTLAGFTASPHAVVGRASLFVLPSRWEGLPLSLAEALACGTPCVAFDCVAGPTEVLAGGKHGRLVAAGDVDALAEAVVEHLQHPEQLRAMATQAAAADLDIFDPARSASRHRAALVRLVAGRD